MEVRRSIRWLLALAVLLGLVLLLSSTINLVSYVLDLQQRLETAPLWFSSAVIVLLISFVVAGLWLLWRILRGGERLRPVTDAPITETGLQERISQAKQLGVDVKSVEAEMADLSQRRSAGILNLALFGEISTGKSALVNALLPNADVQTGVVGGTTTELQRYRLQRDSGDVIELTDMPGVNQLGRDYDRLASEEAQRAHIVIYMLDGDLSREHLTALQPLLNLHKPLIVAVNKLDQYSQGDRDAILASVKKRLSDQPHLQVVGISASPMQRRIEVGSDGKEHEVLRMLPPHIEPLREALHKALSLAPQLLEQLRDAAVFALAADQLDLAQRQFREERGQKIVRQYTQKAMVGGMAAIGPGTDLVIQGVLGVGMVRELAALHGVKVREIEINQLFERVQGRVGRATPLLLAIAGNTLKAFPGIGTVAGGLLHSVAYGLLFDAFGKAANAALLNRGELSANSIGDYFEEQLRDNLESRAARFARLALAGQRAERHDKD